MRAEDREEEPKLLFTVTDDEGNVVRRLTSGAAGAKAGLKRITWDLRYPAANPTRLGEGGGGGFFSQPPRGPLAAPGTYTVTMAKVVDGVVTQLAEPQTFDALPFAVATFAAQDNEALAAFRKKTARLQRAALGAREALGEAQNRVSFIEKALLDTPGADAQWIAEVRAVELALKDLEEKLTGDDVLGARNEPTPPSIIERVQGVVFTHWYSTVDPLGLHQEGYRIAAEEFAAVLADLKKVVGEDLKRLEDRLEAAGAPWTPGRLPDWKPE